MFEKKEEKKNKIDKETALESFNQFCYDWEIDTDNDDLNEEERDDFKNHRNKIVKAIMKGRLIYFSESESFEYMVSEKTKKHAGKKIQIKRPVGRSLRQMDRAKEGKNIEKTYFLIAHMTEENINFIDSLDHIDQKPLLSISQLFLGS